jgi:pimeloyl-ACP methyl ester carboxylesterase
MLLALLSSLAFGFVVWRAPMWAATVAGRALLRWNGFERVSVATSKGPLVYFRAGTGPVAVFLHGVNDQAGTWARVAPHFTSTHHVVVADLAGHGESAPQAGALSMADLVEGVNAVVAAERGGQRVVLVGNSLGGFLSLIHAHEHPEQVARVVAVNGAVMRGGNMEAARLLLPQTRNDARRLMRALMSRSTPEMPDFVLDDFLRRTPTSPLARLAGGSQAEIDRWLLDDRLSSIQTPVTLIWGQDDGLIPLAYAEQAMRRLPHVSLEVIPSCGHMPQRECPAALVPRLRAILEQAPGADR